MNIGHSQFGRRRCLQIGSGLALSAALAPARSLASSRASANQGAQGVAQPARSCILVYLLGGPSHLDMFDLKPQAPAEIRGPFAPIDTTIPGVQVCEHLPKLAGLADYYALVRSVSHRNSNHTPMIFYTLTGRHTAQPEVDNDVRPPQRADFPHVGAMLAELKQSPTGIPGFVAVPEVAVRSSTEGEFKRARSPLRGGGAGFLGVRFDPLAVNGEPGASDAVAALSPPSGVDSTLEHRAALLAALESGAGGRVRAGAYPALRDQAIVLTGTTSPARQIFSLDDEPADVRERYGSHRFGKALLLARRLAAAGVPMIAVHFNEMTICDGWDTHSGNFAALQSELLPMLDQSLSALLTDLDERGELSQTLVQCFGEFGRTPQINGNAGRDHWGPCSSALLAGAGIQGGRVLGASDSIAAYPTNDLVDPVDLHATMFHCLGLDPSAHVLDPSGRPWAISTGRVLTELL
jgi:hypothetical protein